MTSGIYDRFWCLKSYCTCILFNLIQIRIKCHWTDHNFFEKVFLLSFSIKGYEMQVTAKERELLKLMIHVVCLEFCVWSSFNAERNKIIKPFSTFVRLFLGIRPPSGELCNTWNKYTHRYSSSNVINRNSSGHIGDHYIDNLLWLGYTVYIHTIF